MQVKIEGQRNKWAIFSSIAVCFVVMLLVVVFMNVKNSNDYRGFLEDSIKSQLVSISVAARELIDMDAFQSYNSEEDVAADQAHYDETLASLRSLCDNVGAEYIYALKYVNNQCVFVFDTDTEDTEIFIEYELSPVHLLAFGGQETADLMNVQDEYGSFHTGAVPLWHNGQIAGIISTDITDAFLAESNAAAKFNAAALVTLMIVTMGGMLIVLFVLMRRVQAMQTKLQILAHHDAVTGLPNRAYLMEYLKGITSREKAAPFALFFIDLDNFKRVNDQAGHDAGDELLRHIATFLNNAVSGSKSFRPSAGRLNIAARIGGDEFIHIVTDIETEQAAASMAEKLLADFKNNNFDRFIEKYGVGLSIGVALFPYHTDDYHVLIKYADIAMYQAKRARKNAYHIYSDEMASKQEN